MKKRRIYPGVFFGAGENSFIIATGRDQVKTMIKLHWILEKKGFGFGRKLWLNNATTE